VLSVIHASAGSEKGEINVAGPVQHPHDLNATGNGEIKDDVMADRKAAQTAGPVRPVAARCGSAVPAAGTSDRLDQ
jgi:hypothetical protein